MLRSGFGDEEGFLCAFFAHVWQKCTVLLSVQDYVPAAMAALLPCRLQPLDQSALYLYALTTLPAYRHQGHARRLLDAAKARCSRVFLHAADEDLHALYAHLGWQDCMYARWKRFAAAPGDMPRSASASDYFAARERLLGHDAHILWQEPLCCFAHDMLLSYGGGLYLAKDAAFAVIDCRNRTLIVSEMLGENAPAYASALAHRLGLADVQALVACALPAPGAFALGQCAGEAFPSPLHFGFDFN